MLYGSWFQKKPLVSILFLFYIFFGWNLQFDFGISKPSNSSHFHKKKYISYFIEEV
jgi:hypothetical protein